MEYLIGVVLASVVCFFALAVGLDRERAFYATVLMVVATYYILFAVQASVTSAITSESLAACVFFAVAVAGFKKSPWIIAFGLAGHGVFDVFHHAMIKNAGVPIWWPGFCMSFDILAGVFLSVLLLQRSKPLAKSVATK